MQLQLNQLIALHRDLSAALDAGDVERVQALALLRREKLEALGQVFQAASPSERQRHHATLTDLLGEEHTLLQRCRGLRDELQASLATGPRRPAAAGPGFQQGSLDRQA